MKLARIYCKYSWFRYFLTLSDFICLISNKIDMYWRIHHCSYHWSSQRKLNFISKSTYSSSQQPSWIGTVVIHIFQIRKWGRGWVSDLPKITQLSCGCVEIQIQCSLSQSIYFPTLFQGSTAFLGDTKRWELDWIYLWSDSYR